MSKVIVIKSEQHGLFPEQEAILSWNFSKVEYVNVLQDGWTLEEQKEFLYDGKFGPGGEFFDSSLCFASPIPALLGMAAAEAVRYRLLGPSHIGLRGVLVFHNDRRETKEVPDGKGGVRLIKTVSPTGWILVDVTN